MCVLSFYFDMSEAPDDASIRLWLDDPCGRDLHSEIELPLVRERNRWTARFEGNAISANAGFWLRATICGEPGASWQLEVREEGANVPLLLDGDELLLRKELLVATCHRGPALA
jgi:hypothetical protein